MRLITAIIVTMLMAIGLNSIAKEISTSGSNTNSGKPAPNRETGPMQK